jgi:hypothetical protein
MRENLDLAIAVGPAEEAEPNPRGVVLLTRLLEPASVVRGSRRPRWGSLSDRVADLRPTGDTGRPSRRDRLEARVAVEEHPLRRRRVAVVGGSGVSAHGPAPVFAIPFEKRRISRCCAYTSRRCCGTTVGRSGTTPTAPADVPARTAVTPTSATAAIAGGSAGDGASLPPSVDATVKPAQCSQARPNSHAAPGDAGTRTLAGRAPLRARGR